jgi:hypothetical protein
VPAEDLQKVKNQFAAGEYRRLSSNMAILFQLMITDGLGNWREVNEAGPKYQAVTAEDVKRVANEYFARENRCVAVYTRKPGTGGSQDDAELAKLPAEQQTMARQILSRLKGETDANQLKQRLTKLEETTAAAPAESKPMLDWMKKKVQERIAELEAK